LSSNAELQAATTRINDLTKVAAASDQLARQLQADLEELGSVAEAEAQRQNEHFLKARASLEDELSRIGKAEAEGSRRLLAAETTIAELERECGEIRKLALVRHLEKYIHFFLSVGIRVSFCNE
jgi:hypothetical protein